MGAERLNRVSSVGLVVLSLTALLTVLGGAFLALSSGFDPFHELDEGTAARIFQLSVLALFPVGVLFVASGDWSQPARVMRGLAPPATTTAVAFAVLYYFDHVR